MTCAASTRCSDPQTMQGRPATAARCASVAAIDVVRLSGIFRTSGVRARSAARRRSGVRFMAPPLEGLVDRTAVEARGRIGPGAAVDGGSRPQLAARPQRQNARRRSDRVCAIGRARCALLSAVRGSRAMTAYATHAASASSGSRRARRGDVRAASRLIAHMARRAAAPTSAIRPVAIAASSCSRSALHGAASGCSSAANASATDAGSPARAIRPRASPRASSSVWRRRSRNAARSRSRRERRGARSPPPAGGSVAVRATQLRLARVRQTGARGRRGCRRRDPLVAVQRVDHDPVDRRPQLPFGEHLCRRGR